MFHAEGRTDRQTDGHGEANSHISQFCNASENKFYFQRQGCIMMREGSLFKGQAKAARFFVDSYLMPNILTSSTASLRDLCFTRVEVILQNMIIDFFSN